MCTPGSICQCVLVGAGSRVLNVERRNVFVDRSECLAEWFCWLFDLSLTLWTLSGKRTSCGGDCNPRGQVPWKRVFRALDLSPALSTAPFGPSAAVSQGICLFYGIWNEELQENSKSSSELNWGWEMGEMLFCCDCWIYSTDLDQTYFPFFLSPLRKSLLQALDPETV